MSFLRVRLVHDHASIVHGIRLAHAVGETLRQAVEDTRREQHSSLRSGALIKCEVDEHLILHDGDYVRVE